MKSKLTKGKQWQSTSSTSSSGKYYKQKFNRDWERRKEGMGEIYTP